LQFGSVVPEEIHKKEDIDLSLFDAQDDAVVSRRHVAEIIEARFDEILSYVNSELKTIGREGLLPGGVVFCGGGALLPGAIERAKKTLRLPVQIGYPKTLGGILDQVDTPQFATVIGLLLLAQANHSTKQSFTTQKALAIVPEGVHTVIGKIKQWSKQFLP
jgi:cell division protein FtsA